MTDNDNVFDANSVKSASPPPQQDILREIGQELASRRTIKGLSIVELAEITRINKDFICSLENGDLTRLPGKAFARGFLVCLCQELKIEKSKVLEKFDLYINAREKLEPEFPSYQDPELKEASRSKQKIIKSLNKFWHPKDSSENFLNQHRVAIRSSILLFAAVLGISILLLSRSKDQAAVEMIRGTLPQKSPIAEDQSPALGKNTASTAIPGEADELLGDEALPRGSQEKISAAEEQAQAIIPQKNNKDLGTSPPTSPTEPDKHLPNPENSKSVIKFASSQESSVSASPLGPVAVDKPGASNTIKINIIEPVNIRQQCDGGINQTRLWEKSGEITFSKACELTIYDAAAVEVFFNGNTLGNLGNKNIRRNLSFADPAYANVPMKKF